MSIHPQVLARLPKPYIERSLDIIARGKPHLTSAGEGWWCCEFDFACELHADGPQAAYSAWHRKYGHELGL